MYVLFSFGFLQTHTWDCIYQFYSSCSFPWQYMAYFSTGSLSQCMLIQQNWSHSKKYPEYEASQGSVASVSQPFLIHWTEYHIFQSLEKGDALLYTVNEMMWKCNWFCTSVFFWVLVYLYIRFTLFISMLASLSFSGHVDWILRMYI